MSRQKKKKSIAKPVPEEKVLPAENDRIYVWADNFLFSLTLLLLFLRPFVSGRTYPHFNHFFHMGVCVLFILWLIKSWKTGAIKLHNRLLTGFMLVFLIVCALTFFTTINRGTTLRYIYEIMSYTLLFLVIANNLREGFSIKLAVAVLLAAALLVNIYGLYQRYYTLEMTRRHIESAMAAKDQDLFLGIPLGPGILERLGSTRVFSSFLFPNAYAMYLGFVGALAIGWIWSMRAEMRRFLRNSLNKLSGPKPVLSELSVLEVTLASLLIGSFLGGASAYYLWVVRDRFSSAFVINRPLGEILDEFSAFIVIIAGIMVGMVIWAGIGVLAAHFPAMRRYLAILWHRLKGTGGVLLILIFAVSCVLIPWNLWLTFSRGGWLSALVAVFVICAIMLVRRLRVPRRNLAAAIFLALFLSSVLIPDEANSAQKIRVRKESLLQRLKDSSTVVRRLSYLETGWEMIKDRPWSGVGWGAFEKAYPRYMVLGGHPVKLAHNNYLQVWAETGIIGLNAFVGMWLVFAYAFWRKVNSASVGELRGIACGLGAGVFGFLTHSLVDFDLYLPTLTYLVFALMGLMVAIPAQEDEDDRFSFRIPREAIPILIICACVYFLFLFRSFMGLWIANRVETERNTVFPTAYAMKKGFKQDPERQRMVLEESIPLLKKSTRYFPLDADTHHMLGDTYLRLAQTEDAPYLLDEAITSFQRAGELNPLSPYVFQSLATAYWLYGNKMRKPEMLYNALQAEKRASENFPVNPEYRAKLGQIYKALGMKEEAREEFRKAQELKKYYKDT